MNVFSSSAGKSLNIFVCFLQKSTATLLALAQSGYSSCNFLGFVRSPILETFAISDINLYSLNSRIPFYNYFVYTYN